VFWFGNSRQPESGENGEKSEFRIAQTGASCDGQPIVRALQLTCTLGVCVWFAGTAQAQSPKLSIHRGPAPLKLEISGKVGDRFLVEQTSTPAAPDSWGLLMALTLATNSHQWFDSASLTAPQRFYRLLSPTGAIEPPPAYNFRLIDNLGVSRELYYNSTERAVVLAFTDSTCPQHQQMLAVLASLRDQYASQGVLFWVIDTSAEARSTVSAQVANSAPGLPVLRDRGQLVARAFGVSIAPEIVAVNATDWTVFYRGAINDGGADSTPPGTRQHYLANALTRFLADHPISIHQTRASGCPIELPRTPISYSADVGPLLVKNCVSCHSPGNIGPWSMTNHAVVQAFASSIRTEVLTGRMPPWHADPAHGLFANDVSLKPAEAAILLQWIDDGAPRGSGPDPLAETFASTPPPADYPATWPASLGKPDYVISIPRQTIPATGHVPYKHPQVVARIPSNVWLRAAVVLPGNTRVVHHSLVFAGSLAEVILNAGGLNGYFAAYVPGMKQEAYPAGTGKFLRKDSALTVQMHYTTTGKTETDQTQVGLYFLREPPTMELVTRSAFTLDIAVPPGEKDYAREAYVTPSATRDVWLYEVSPHMHYRGSRFKFEAMYPNGTSEVLLSVPKYDFHWQTLYRLAQPKRLPAGTIVRCTGAFDNSAQNLENPDPSVTVRFGEQTYEEMFIGYLNFAVIP